MHIPSIVINHIVRYNNVIVDYCFYEKNSQHIFLY